MRKGSILLTKEEIGAAEDVLQKIRYTPFDDSLYAETLVNLGVAWCRHGDLGKGKGYYSGWNRPREN